MSTSSGYIFFKTAKLWPLKRSTKPFDRNVKIVSCTPTTLTKTYFGSTGRCLNKQPAKTNPRYVAFFMGKIKPYGLPKLLWFSLYQLKKFWELSSKALLTTVLRDARKVTPLRKQSFNLNKLI